jgi:integrase
MKKSAVLRKVGDTHQEAVKNRLSVLTAIQKEIDAFEASCPIDGAFGDADNENLWVEEELRRNLKARGLDNEQIESILHGQEAMEKQGLNYKPVKRLETKLNAKMEGMTDWEEWITRRIIAESPAKSTVQSWRSRLKKLVGWFESPYLGTMTKKDASNYKAFLLQNLKPSSVKTDLQSLGGFWNWLIEDGEIDTNIWTGLSKKLKSSPKKLAVPKVKMDEAIELADKNNDLQFFIQSYTGCRKGEHSGLRFCDIDLVDNVIRFELWRDGEINRRFKGGEKDERIVPIHTNLRKKIIQMMPEIETNNSTELVFGMDYSKNTEQMGTNWSHRFADHYGFNSHELRAYVVSQLMALNVSPFHLYEITRHSIPGMSAVVQGYVRPSMDELREMIERLK